MSLLENDVRLPEGIHFEKSCEDSSVLTMQMEPCGMGYFEKRKEPLNMQDDGAAFEAWALLAKAFGDEKIELRGEPITCNDFQYHHYNRFLYRVMRFHENFGQWFLISEKLLTAVSHFREAFNSHELKYNVPDKPSAEVSKQKPEAIMEKHFCDNPVQLCGLIGIPECEIFRQLPVGLFIDEVSKKTRIFPGGSAAIDLWAISENCMHIIELKAKDNKSLGILSELFFYTCFAYDFYCKKLGEPGRESKERGFDRLLSTSITKVVGHILTETEHPHLEKALSQLNLCSNKDISFTKKKYDAQALAKGTS